MFFQALVSLFLLLGAVWLFYKVLFKMFTPGDPTSEDLKSAMKTLQEHRDTLKEKSAEADVKTELKEVDEQITELQEKIDRLDL